MSKNKLPLDEIKALAEILKDQELTEIELENDDLGKIKVRRENGSAAAIVAAPAAPVLAAPVATSSAPSVDSDLIEVSSPMVGTFYQSSAPGAEPFVKVGDKVSAGDTLCIVEAMKLMNELPAEISGEIAEICVSDAQAVSFGQVLMKIKKS